MKKHLNVVAAVIHNEQNEILCALRSPVMALPNLWEFPGGKIEEGESHETALIREIQEELNIEIEVGENVEDTYFEYENFTIQLTSYFASINSGEMKATEHAELRWVTIDKLKDLEWAPADIPAVLTIKNLQNI
ncbi:(deoxy)nucleoside triphosphate pyrophosphohydrolase [Paenisporosarcina sp. TG-14]|uniref:(deoxy)nucleoside triphosphate pyrophosphohydrolase n=1 Tax=Paenisporosarcina sp. TG-14 TaxID=1231057 RepID=UPI0002DAA9A1|nr:(deoxy)nucleoside triphosphate pyrophosphohydrolase [Paenisporosarcina sp. TG-14]